MTAVAWPCSTCGAAGLRNMGTHGCCPAHLSELYSTFGAEAWDGLGVGLQAGARRPDHGPEYVELRCVVCNATWVGALFDVCGWCERRLDAQREHHAEVLLRPELPGGDDIRHEPAAKSWGERLARGVEAGLVSRDEALAAWRREVGDDRCAA